MPIPRLCSVCTFELKLVVHLSKDGKAAHPEVARCRRRRRNAARCDTASVTGDNVPEPDVRSELELLWQAFTLPKFRTDRRSQKSVQKVLGTCWPLALVRNTFQKVNVLEVYCHRSTLSSNRAREAGHMSKKICFTLSEKCTFSTVFGL